MEYMCTYYKYKNQSCWKCTDLNGAMNCLNAWIHSMLFFKKTNNQTNNIYIHK